MTDASRRANIVSELARADESMRAARLLVEAGLLHELKRVESDYGRDFPLTPEALREDLEACEGFLSRARSTIAVALR